MALGTGTLVGVSSLSDVAVIKLSEEKIIAISDWFTQPLMLTFTGSGVISFAFVGSELPQFLSIHSWCPLTYPYDNRIIAFLYDNQTLPGEVIWYLAIIEFSLSVDGDYTIYSQQEFVSPAGSGEDSMSGNGPYSITMVSATQGYCLVQSPDDTLMYMVPFTISGNTISQGSGSIVGTISTGDYPVHAFGDGNGNVLVLWENTISATAYRYYDITSGMSVGSPNIAWSTDPNESWGQGIEQRQQLVDRYTSAWGWMFFGDEEYNKAVKYTAPTIDGPIEQTGAYPPNSNVIGSAAIVTFGLGAQGVFAWKETTTGTDFAWVAFFDLDEITGEIIVDQDTRISTTNVQHYKGFYPMLGGTEAALILRETIGSASTQVQAITGLPGYVSPPPGDNGMRLWIFKGNGIDWTSRGLKVA